MHFQHGHTGGRWRTGEYWRSAARPRRRILVSALGGILALILLPFLGVVPAQAAAGQITEFPLTQGGPCTQCADAGRMTLGADGDLYFGGSTIGRITPSGQVTQFALPDTTQNFVYLTALGPDHNVWFASNGTLVTSKLGRITSAGQITMFSVPLFDGQPFVQIEGLTAGSDGNLWFTANAGTSRSIPASFVGRVDPATGAVTEFPIPSGLTNPGALTLGSDGNLWFPIGNNIARVTPSGQISEFPAPQGGPSTFSDSGRMALGADGDLYFGGSTIGRITPSGQVTQFALPDPTQNFVYVTATGPDHNVWFASNGSATTSRLGRITPAGQITTFSVPLFHGLPFVQIAGLAAGSDGNLWFTANAATSRRIPASFVGRVDPATGAVTEFPIPSGATIPGALTTGSDGNLWFPEGNGPGIARVTTH